MGVTGGHDDRLALLKDGVLAVDGDAAHAVQASDKGITFGLVGADLLPLVEGEQGHADGIVLGQGLADHLAGLIVHLLLQDQGLALGNVLHRLFHSNFPFLRMLFPNF